MLLYFLWIVLPLVAFGQTYYINFVFNNNRYANFKEHLIKDLESLESHGRDEHDSVTHKHKDTVEVSSAEQTDEYDDTTHRPNHSMHKPDKVSQPENTDEIIEYSDSKSRFVRPPITKNPTHNTNTTILNSTSTEETDTEDPPVTESTSTDMDPIKITTGSDPIEITTEIDATQATIDVSTTVSSSPNWTTPTPHPESFFDYPEATCHEDMDYHELFGITLARDRGLPSKVLCEFNNSWGGPWVLMNRMELPARVHMRHWFFGYVTEDYKDLNINFLALAHIMNTMRVAMLIIGQNNNSQLVYNLYDDVVISGFDDLFMLRKAHLVEANTTDLLFISLGEVLESDTGRKRTCPFRVLGAWWGPKWGDYYSSYCVFPVDRDINLPGYMAIFIKPSPFEVNNTAFYANAITTRRPWASSIDPVLFSKANNDLKEYKKLHDEEYIKNKKLVKDELRRREEISNEVEILRLSEDYNDNNNDIQVQTATATTTDQTLPTT